MATYPFLSDEWIAEARRIHEAYRRQGAEAPPDVRMNLVVTDVPFGAGTIDAHVDTTSGELDLELGHLDAAEATLTLDYDTARAILVDQDQQAVMKAFMGGRIKVQGDMTKLIVLQGSIGTADAAAFEAAGRIRAMTE